MSGDAFQAVSGGESAAAGDERPLRFAMLTTFYPPHSFGGDGILVRRMARALAARGHEVAVVYSSDAFRWLGGPHDGRTEEVTPADRGILRYDLTSRPSWLAPLLAQQSGSPGALSRHLRGLLVHGGFDVVHFHNISLLGPRVLTYDVGGAARLWTLHDHWAVCPMHVLWRYNRELCDARDCLRCALAFRRPPQLWRGTSLMEDCAAAVDVCLAQSAFSMWKHREWGFSPSLQILEPFVARAEVGAADAQDASPHPRPYFLFAGRLERVKGVDALVRVACASDPAADVLIAGEGGEAASLRRLAVGSERVRFLGWVGTRELDALYRHALAVVIPSAGYETFGLVAIEAFARGTPVVVRDIGPLPEIAAGRGLVFGTDAELAGALRSLASSPDLRAELARRARADFLARWTEEAFLERYFGLLDALPGRPHATRRPASPRPILSAS